MRCKKGHAKVQGMFGMYCPICDPEAGADVIAYKASQKDHINPSHYQAYMVLDGQEIQWLETMCRIRRYRDNPDQFIAAVELQVRKYLDRNGEKDPELQESLKGLWYHKFMVAYIKNGKVPIYVRDIDSILAEG